MNYSELTTKWLERQKNYIKESTYSNYTYIINNHILPELGDTKIEELSEELLEKFIFKKLESNLSPLTVRNILSVVKLVINFGNKLELIKHMEININFRKEIQIYKVFSNDEIKLIISKLETAEKPMFIGLLIALYSGIRIGELSALKYSDIINNNIYINKTLQRNYIDGKTKISITTPKSIKSNRIIPLHESILIVNDTDNYVLTNSQKAMEPRLIRYHYTKLLKELNIKHRPFHYLRHTFATNLINNTGDIKTVSELLGHSSVSVTMDIYTHTNQKNKQKCINKYLI